MLDVLMVCTGNICRSPMAEYFLRSMLPPDLAGRVRVHSAGVHALDGHGVTPEVLLALKPFEIDPSPHVARSVDPAMVRRADLVLAMEPFQADILRRGLAPHEAAKVRLLGEFGARDLPPAIDDPYGSPLQNYRQAAARIRECVAGVVAHLTARGASCPGSPGGCAPPAR